MHGSSEELKFGQIGPPTAELGAKIPIDLENGVVTFFSAVLAGSFSYLQVTIAYIRTRMSSKFGKI